MSQNFRVGYDEHFEKLLFKKAKYIARCESCRFFDDVCTNANVTSFDVVEDEDRRFCVFWQPEEAENG